MFLTRQFVKFVTHSPLDHTLMIFSLEEESVREQGHNKARASEAVRLISGFHPATHTCTYNINRKHSEHSVCS